MCAITFNNLIICGKWQSESLQIVNSTLQTIKEIKLKSGALKIIISDDRDHLIVGESAGIIEIISIHNWEVV